MTGAGDVPPPISCALIEHRAGAQVQIEVRLRSESAQTGTYRLQVIKQGRSGQARINQESAFALDAGRSVRIDGPSLSMEPSASYRATLSVHANDITATCERTGPESSDTL